MRTKIASSLPASGKSSTPSRVTREARRQRVAPAPKVQGIAVEQLPGLLDSWIRTCKVRQMTVKTTSERARVVGIFIAYARFHGFTLLDRALIEGFLSVLGTADRPWEETPHQRGKPIAPLRPVSVQSYYRILRTFCNWLVEEEYIEVSPMTKVKPPVARPDQIEPLTHQQVAQLVAGAKASEYPLRNVAIIYLILDTGLRVSELCGLTMADIDLDNWSLRVMGKGNKARTVYAGSRAAQRALSEYLRLRERGGREALFQSERGHGHFTAMGVYHIVHDCGKLGGVSGIGPHDLRHTFAFNFIRGGGSEFTLQTMLGHTSLSMTRKYVNLAGADLSAQARAVGALDAVLRKK